MTHQPHKEQGGRALRAPVGDGLSSLRDRAPAGLAHSASIPREESPWIYENDKLSKASFTFEAMGSSWLFIPVAVPVATIRGGLQ